LILSILPAPATVIGLLVPAQPPTVRDLLCGAGDRRGRDPPTAIC
jgi:hypothetical protein